MTGCNLLGGRRQERSAPAEGGDRPALETLEPRLLLSASISGVVWNDADGDQSQGGSEQGLQDWRVFADLDSDGQWFDGTTTVASADIPKTIPDDGPQNGKATSNLDVSGLSGTITDVNLTLNVTHTFINDLWVELYSPNDTRVVLLTRVQSDGENFENFTDTTLDDEATTPIETAPAPCTGSFTPDWDLSLVDGEGPNGRWRLEVDDQRAGDTGTLDSWSLTFRLTGVDPEPSALTGPDGSYTITGLGAGTHRVAQVLQADWERTFPTLPYHSVPVGENDTVGGIDFGNRLINEAPVAQDATITVDENAGHRGAVEATDADPGATLTYAIETAPTHGAITDFDPDTGVYIYEPDMHYTGGDSFTFTANDGHEDSNVATVSIDEVIPFDVLAREQRFIYLVNYARNDPVRYENEQALPVDLSYVAPRPPLAFNWKLSSSSRFHGVEMATYNYWGHQSAVTGDWPNKVVRDRAYRIPSLWPEDQNNLESIAGGTIYTTAQVVLNALIVDEGWDPPGHRDHLLGIGSFDAGHREIGVGYGYSPTAQYTNYWAIHATRTDTSDTFVTGVVFSDLNGNGWYDLNEGLGAVPVTVGGETVLTNAAGGWSVQVDTPGDYVISVAGGAFVGTATETVTVGSDNIEVDFVSGQPRAIVDFNHVPLAEDDSFTVTAGASHTDSLSATDADPGDVLTYAIATDPAHGTITAFNPATGAYTYQADGAYDGPDSFGFTAGDGELVSDEATVSVTVESAGQPEISVTDSSGAPGDHRIRFMTPLSQFRSGVPDNPFVRPAYPDRLQYIDVKNTGTALLTISEIQINAPDVSVTGAPTADITIEVGQTHRFPLAYEPSVPSLSDPTTYHHFDRLDGLVILSDADNAASVNVALQGDSTFDSDITYDGAVNLGELGPLNANFGREEGGPDWDPTADINGDDVVNLGDLGPLNAEFGNQRPLASAATSAPLASAAQTAAPQADVDAAEVSTVDAVAPGVAAIMAAAAVAAPKYSSPADAETDAPVLAVLEDLPPIDVTPPEKRPPAGGIATAVFSMPHGPGAVLPGPLADGDRLSRAGVLTALPAAADYVLRLDW